MRTEDLQQENRAVEEAPNRGQRWKQRIAYELRQSIRQKLIGSQNGVLVVGKCYKLCVVLFVLEYIKTFVTFLVSRTFLRLLFLLLFPSPF